MDKQQLIVVLLVVAIIFSALNVAFALGFDVRGLGSGSGTVNLPPESDSGNIGIEILDVNSGGMG